jgi:hypothetical protein
MHATHPNFHIHANHDFHMHATHPDFYRHTTHPDFYIHTGVEITTRQLAKCEWNLELASNFLNLLAKLASVFPLSEFFSPLTESYSSRILKYKHTPDTVIYLLLLHTHSHDGLFFE